MQGFCFNTKKEISFKFFFIAIILLILSTSFFTSCVSRPSHQQISRKIYSQGLKTEQQLVIFFLSQNPTANKDTVKRLAHFYIIEAEQEGINSDCAFVQMCLETGFLKFGGLVTPQMHNYCGLGSMDKEHPGETFATEQLGVRAHIQHLHAYSTTEDITLNNPCIDKRYKYVKPRGKAPSIFSLAGTWAMDKQYGEKLNTLLNKLEQI